MKAIHKLLVIIIVFFVSCKKEPNEVSPPAVVVDAPFHYYPDFRVDAKAIYGDNDGNCNVIGNGYVYKLNSIGSIINILKLAPGTWADDNAYTNKGHFYSRLLSTSQPEKEKLIIYEATRSEGQYFSPMVVDIKQTKLENPNDEAWYWFGNNYPNQLNATSAEFGTLQTATKFVKNGNTGKIDTFSVLLNIEYPFGVTDSQEIILPKVFKHLVFSTNKYVIVSGNDYYWYRYDNKLNYIDSFPTWPNPPLYVIENQFLFRERGYFLSPDGSDNGVKIDLLEEKDLILNVHESIIYGLTSSGDVFSIDLKTNSRTNIINVYDKRFNNQGIGIFDVWRNKKGKYFLFATNGLYVF